MYAAAMEQFDFPVGIAYDMPKELRKILMERVNGLQKMGYKAIRMLTGGNMDLFNYDFEEIWSNETEMIEDEEYTNKTLEKSKCMAFSLEVTIEPNKQDIEASTPRRKEDDTISWDVCDRKQWLTDVDLYIALSNGWIIKEIHNGVYYHGRMKILK